MSSLKIISWNTRGLNSPIKRSLVFQFVKSYHPQICVFQETHLVGKRTFSLKKPWVGYHYHSTHSTFSRGVSILILKTLPFRLLDLALDPEGRFVVLHALLYNVPWVIVGLYLPPPASLHVLNQITGKIAEFHTENVLLLGDFNLVPDESLDRLSTAGTTRQGLSDWADTYGFYDIWRWKYPQTKAYTCHSASHKTFSRIDLVYAGRPVLSKVRDVTILPRGISDHAPILLDLNVSTAQTDKLWRLSRYWVSDIEVEPKYKDELESYWQLNPGSASPFSVWDAFKAYSRGQYQTIIGQVRGSHRRELLIIEAEAQRQEALYIRSPNPQTYTRLQSLLGEVLSLRTALTQKRLLHQKQRIFEQGEKTGHLLAWLSKEQSVGMTIGQIQAGDGTLTSTPEGINDVFASYYQTLYQSQTSHAPEDLLAYLEKIDIPTLTQTYADKLDAPINIEEIQKALKMMQTGKTPGPDGFPVEFYKTYAEQLAPRLQSLFAHSFQEGRLPDSMHEAIIVVIHKQGKDPKLCSSYRPISLLNVDIKIIAKILANRLNTVITALIHPDQTGFMPGRGTDINIRRLHTHIAIASPDRPGVVASLDAEKAFDSVEWGYLWAVLSRFGFGPRFRAWIQMLYAQPRARIHTNGVLSKVLRLERGTRQGCPLSPALFSLALEPLAILLRAEEQIKGIRVGALTEKVSLYADDTILYLADASTSLKTALAMFDYFGRFSGIRINWNKSILFPLCRAVSETETGTPLKWVDEFTYLGIKIGRALPGFLERNVLPLLNQLQQKCLAWKSLPLTPVGRGNLLKMVFLPKFLYYFRNTPTPIPKSFFSKLESVVISFIWAGKPPRVAKNTLYLPLSGGGLALPNFLMYYWAAVMVTVRWWFSQPRQNPAVTLEAALLGSYAALSNLPYRGPRADPAVTGPMKTTIQVWKSSRASLIPQSQVSPHTPLWANPMLPHLFTVPDPAIWAKRGITTIKHVMPRGVILSFRELQATYHIPRSFLFRYWQLQHALKAQFPAQISLEPDPIECLLTSGMLDKHEVKNNKSLTKLQGDIPALGEEEWEECLTTFIPYMIAAKDRFIQLKFIHRAYYTPERLARIYPILTPTCTRCELDTGTFYHMVWSCPKLHHFWRSVADTLERVCGIEIPLDPLTCLLSHLEDIAGDRYTKLFLTYSLFYARREILLKWKQKEAPTKETWLKAINNVLPLYRITYESRNCPQKYDKVWSSWIDACG